MVVTNGVTVSVDGPGPSEPDGRIVVRFSAERDNGSYSAEARIDAGRPLRLSGRDRDVTVGEAPENDVVHMAAQELIGIVERTEVNVAPLKRLLVRAIEANAPSDEIEAMRWALDQARGYKPSSAKR